MQGIWNQAWAEGAMDELMERERCISCLCASMLRVSPYDDHEAKHPPTLRDISLVPICTAPYSVCVVKACNSKTERSEKDWWLLPMVLLLGKLRQENCCEFHTSQL